MGRQSDARERLIETAMALIHERGYQAVGVQEICSQAGVNKGSFYHYFPSKAHLVFEAIDRYVDGLVQSVHDIAQAKRPALQKVQQLFEMAHEQLSRSADKSGKNPGCPLANLALEASQLDDRIRLKISGAFDRWAQSLEPVIREAVANHEIEPVDTATAAMALVGYLEGLVVMAKTHNDPQVVLRLAPGALALLRCGSQLHSATGPTAVARA